MAVQEETAVLRLDIIQHHFQQAAAAAGAVATVEALLYWPIAEPIRIMDQWQPTLARAGPAARLIQVGVPTQALQEATDRLEQPGPSLIFSFKEGEWMQRKFFHNKHDRISREALALLEPDVQVIDVYGGEYANFGRDVLDQYEIHQMPYLIDREVIMLSAAQQTAGTFTLDFEVRDHLGALVTELVDVHIYLTVAGVERHEVVSTSTGSFSLELTCSTAQEIGLRITDYNADDGIDIFETTVEVSAA